jgi:hypothetical protein
MPDRPSNYSPQRDARIAGLLYVLIMVGGYYSEGIVRSSIVVAGNAAATAQHIAAAGLFYRSGVATQLAVLLCDTTVAVLLFNVLRPVSHTLALLAALSRVVFVAILGASAMFYFAPLYLLKSPTGVPAINPSEAQALALISLRLYSKGFQIGLIFFGLNILLIGVLIARSTFLPRLLGVLLALAGTGYLVFSFLSLLVPPAADKAGLYLLLLGFVAELSLTLWLTIRGVNVAKWWEEAGWPEQISV